MHAMRFIEPLLIQRRVIVALMQRDFISIYGRDGLGFLMLFMEPLVIIGCLTVFVAYRHIAIHATFPMLSFTLSGWGIMWICRYPINKMHGAVAANASFLYHRNIKVFDLLISRSLFLLIGTVSSFSFLFVIYVSVFDNVIYDSGFFLLSLFLTAWYSFFMAMAAGAIGAYMKLGEKLIIVLSIFHAFSTGAFFMVDWLPEKYQSLILYLPLVHNTEMMRYGLFGNVVDCHFDILYPVMCNILLTFFVVMIVMFFSKTRNIHGFSQ